MPIFARDLAFPEAPVLLEDGSHLFTEMSPDTGWVLWVSKDGQSRRVVAKTGRPNGLAADREGFIWVAETLNRSLLRITLDGETEKIVGEGEGRPFLFLNDLAFAPNGDLYLTDSGIAMDDFAPSGKLNPDFMSLDYDGRVYRVEVGLRTVETIDRKLRFTNGIAFGPDGDLYVAETLTGMIHRYQWRDGKVAGGRTPFGNVIDPDGPEGIRGPDGMKFGADGHLYVAVFGQGNVTVLDRDGALVRRHPTAGLWPTNLHFGESGERSIYVTEAETGTVQIIEVETDGFPLFL
ncbi:MAG TPA: SMP-30/gluconolactonase/LRE family protein [Woeseiaceae bacterium]|nr:SMP-30/gluconolactonase/LRE family protein [Woeseiaceae bacterium]